MKRKEVPYINPETCAGCSVCVENCPMDCLRIEEPAYHGDIHTKAVLDESKCIGCGLCAKVCPIRAIEMHRGKEGKLHMEERWSLKRLYCRGFQAGMKIGMYVLPWRLASLLVLATAYAVIQIIPSL